MIPLQSTNSQPLDLSVWKHIIFWLLAALVFTLGWDTLGWDLPVSRYFANSQGFALTAHPIWGKGLYLSQRSLAWLTLFAVVWICWRPIWPFSNMLKAERIAMLCTVILSIFVIQYFKRKSLTSCPWSLQEFGGQAQYVSHWLIGVRDGDSGRCFPAGHSSGALCFLAVPVYLLWHNKRWAYWTLLVVLIAGSIWGGTQVFRGAHYVSHTLWTGTICLCVAVLLRGAWFVFKQYRRV